MLGEWSPDHDNVRLQCYMTHCTLPDTRPGGQCQYIIVYIFHFPTA